MTEPIVGYTTSSGLVEVEKVMYYAAKDGKKSFVKVPVRHREYFGGRGKEANYVTRYATLVAWSEIADAMQNLVAGDIVAFEGAGPSAGRPYENSKGEYSATSEHKIRSWYKIEGAGEPQRGSGPDPRGAMIDPAANFAASAAAHDAAGKAPAAGFEADGEAFNDPFSHE